jgi:excisionase family DNA binding protein
MSQKIEFTPSPRILRGLDEIAHYLRVSRRTAWRWVRDHQLPAMRYPSREYMTTTSLLDLWILAWCNTQWARRTLDELGELATEGLREGPHAG